MAGPSQTPMSTSSTGAQAPFYQSQGNEVALFEAAYAARLPVMVKGPTGCGKSRFIEYMAHRLGRTADHRGLQRGHDGRPTWWAGTCSTPTARAGRTGR